MKNNLAVVQKDEHIKHPNGHEPEFKILKPVLLIFIQVIAGNLGLQGKSRLNFFCPQVVEIGVFHIEKIG